MKNFGKIRSVYNEILAEGVSKKDDAKKAVFQTYLKALKENEILKTQFLVYKNIEDRIEENEIIANEYIKENISLFDEYTKAEILEANNRLSEALTEGQGEEVYAGNDKLKGLHENITNLIFTEKNAKTIDTIVESTSAIIDYMKGNTSKVVKESLGVSNEALIPEVVTKFNEEYAELSESEREVFKVIVEGTEEDRINLYKSSIKECLKLVNEQIKNAEIDLKESLLSLKESLLDREYTNEGFENEIFKLIELQEDLK